jgi:type II secretion system protein D
MSPFHPCILRGILLAIAVGSAPALFAQQDNPRRIPPPVQDTVPATAPPTPARPAPAAADPTQAPATAPSQRPVQPPSQVTDAPASAAAPVDPAAVPAPGAEPMVDVQFPNTPIPVILGFYEELTKTRVIRDLAVQDKNLSVQTSGKMTRADAAEFIEKSFLLNGYAILPTDKPDQRKIIAYNSEKKPSSEGLPVYTTPFQLPTTDEVVTYIMPLSFLLPEDAAELFTNVVVLHPYGKITPLQSASAIVITESTSVIRRMIELRDHVDVSPIRTVDQAFQLERADAEDVVEALTDILGLEQDAGATGGNANQPSQPNQPGQPNQPSPAPAANGSNNAFIPSQAGGNGNFARPSAPKPRVRAIARANRVLVVATPSDMEYITSIISHLDAPVETATYLRRQLRYINVSDFLKIAGNVITRGLTEDGGNSEIAGGNEDRQQEDGGLGDNQNDTFNNQDMTGMGNTRRSGGATGDLGNAGSDQAAAPQSVVIDKTLLIADNIQNMLIASGPPENLRQIEELLDSMDVRPVQIQISAIISQMTLGNNYEFALNFLRTLEQPTDGATFNGGGALISRTPDKLFNIGDLADPTKLGATSGLNLYGQINKYLDMHLKALENTNRFEVLSRPTIYTVNNRQAVIETGERVAVPRSTLSSLNTTGINNNNNQVVTANIDYENVVLRIAVVPLINANGEITLQIQQKNDSITGERVIGGDAIPTIGTQSLGTTVMIPDGGTVLLGGLISEDDGKSQAGVPLFANWPLVGRVFGSTSDKINRKELLIFIQPKVIRSEFDQTFADEDLKNRTRVALPTEEFAENTDNNLDIFESQDFNSAEKRVFFFRDLFKKKPAVRAVPVE